MRTIRLLTRPLRRQFWWPGVSKKNRDTDRPGVVIISFSEIGESDETLLARDFPLNRRHRLLDQDLPPVHTWEHDEPEQWWDTAHRFYFFLYRTVTAFGALLRGRRTWSRHLTETDDLARLYAGLASGHSFLHIGTVQYDRRRVIRQLKRFLSGLELRRYEMWIVVRSSKCCYLPTTMQLPEVPLRSTELVEMARAYPCLESRLSFRKIEKPVGTIRIMSYNLHSCIGLDGRASVQRIAEVLHRYDPDFVALQELDVGCERSGGTHQVEELKRLWPSEGEFFPLISMRGGSYGIGFLSRLRVTKWEGVVLPQVEQIRPQEPRGLLRVWVTLEHDSGEPVELEILNTHLGLTQKARLTQLAELIRSSDGDRASSQILTGDFNCSPKSEEYRILCRHWKPTQSKPEKTWFGTFPTRHLDYCFVRGEATVVSSMVPKDSLTRVASDHLPLMTDFELPSS
jgi:endonuclease/exonuclease/phosphatase family metal-dependent hydrolase